MKLITRDTDYAVRALIYMARRPESVVSVEELVGKIKIPRAFLRRLLQSLNKHKILKSLKGKGGGFMLNTPSGRIRIIDLMKIFQKDASIVNCLFKKSICPNIKACPLRRRIKKVEKDVHSQLRSITIESLLRGG